MKKLFKIIRIILSTIIIIGIIFLTIDYSRVNKQEKPIFCFKYKGVNDGGTKEYLGVGYKIIEYNKLNGYNKIHIGSWFMKYNENLSENIEIDEKTTSKNFFELIYNREKNLGIDTIVGKDEFVEYDYNIYSYGGNVQIKIGDELSNLRDALMNNKIDIQDIIDKCIQDEKEGKIKTDIYKDGGSTIYKNETYWIIKCNSLDENKDLYIGMPNMNFTGSTVELSN